VKVAMWTGWIGVLALMVWSASAVSAQTPNPQETLQQHVASLQNNPNDYALREKIIKLAQEMQPAPAIPEEARRHYVKARALSEDAKQPSDFADAAEEFQKALLIAPWWGEAYMLMGVTLEAAQRYDAAIAALKLSMATKPSAEVLRKTQDEIYKIEAKVEKAAKESSPAAMAAKTQQASDEWLKKLDGARYTRSFWDDDSRTTITYAIEIKGKSLVETTNAFARRQWGDWLRCEISGREFVYRWNNSDVEYGINENTITERYGGVTRVFNRVR